MKPLLRCQLSEDPFVQFSTWYDQAGDLEEIAYANAFCLSTLDSQGYPEGRIVLLKEFDERGFVFYTNSRSAKGRSLQAQPKAGMTFYWDPLGRQVRVKGEAELLPSEESDRYFAERSRESRIGAWASNQSEVLRSRSDLDQRVEELTAEFKGKDIPRPEYWNGYRIKPYRIEFWQFGPNRLHDRFEYSLTENGWEINRLSP